MSLDFDMLQHVLNQSPAVFRPVELENSEHKKRRKKRKRMPFKDFIKNGAWDVLEPFTPLSWNWHNDDLCDVMEAFADGDIRFLAINVPPGSMKSLTVAVFFPAWVWTWAPHKQFLCAAHSASLSKRDSIRSRDLMRSDWYKANFGHAFRMVDGNKTYQSNDQMGKRMITSTGAGATGQRADYLIVDDIVSAKKAYSDAHREGANRWFFEEFSNRMNNPKKSGIVLIGQRLHELDVFGRLKDLGYYDWIVLPTRYNSDRFKFGHNPIKKTPMDDDRNFLIKDPRTKDGEWLHPERHSEEEDIREHKNLGSHGYSSQHDQDPTPEGGSIIKTNWMEYRWSVLPAFAGEWIQSWDPKAGGESETSSRVAGQLWFRPYHQPGRAYLVDQVKGVWDIVETVAQMRQLAHHPLWGRASVKLVEDKADGLAILKMLKAEVPGLKPFRVGRHGGKRQRYRAVAPFWEAGNVWLPEDNDPRAKEWLPDFLIEHSKAPGWHYLDQIDASTMALLYYFVDQELEKNEGDENWDGWFEE